MCSIPLGTSNSKTYRSAPARVRKAATIQPSLALQLRFFGVSESMGDHDSEIMDDLDRDDVGAVGVLASGCEGADQTVVHASEGGRLVRFVPRRFARG